MDQMSKQPMTLSSGIGYLVCVHVCVLVQLFRCIMWAHACGGQRSLLGVVYHQDGIHLCFFFL